MEQLYQLIHLKFDAEGINRSFDLLFPLLTLEPFHKIVDCHFAEGANRSFDLFALLTMEQLHNFVYLKFDTEETDRSFDLSILC